MECIQKRIYKLKVPFGWASFVNGAPIPNEGLVFLNDISNRYKMFFSLLYSSLVESAPGQVTLMHLMRQYLSCVLQISI